MVNFQDMIYSLDRMGVVDVLFPFILIFAIVFAILQKTKIFGTYDDGKTPKKNINAIVALVMAFAVVVPHVLGTYPPNADIVVIINSALPNVSVILVAILAFLLLIGMFGGEWKLLGNSISGWIALLSAIIIVFIFGTSAGWWGNGSYPYWLSWLNDPDTQALVLIILVFGIVVWFITREPKPEGHGKKSFFEELGKMVEKK